MRKKGYFIESVKTKRNILEKLYFKTVSCREISLLCNGLGTMIRTGMPVSRAINIVASQFNKKVVNNSLNDIERTVIRGESLYYGFKKYCNIYPLFMIEMINLGEKSGRLEKVLINLSNYYDKQHKISMKIKSAIAYPTMVLIISTIIVSFLMTKIVPEFITTLGSMNGKVPVITQMVLSLCTFLEKNLNAINVIIFIFVFSLYKVSKTDKFRFYFDKLKISNPFSGRLYEKLTLSRFAETTSMLLASGHTITEALEIVGSILGNKIIQEKIDDSIKSINTGKSILSSFEKNKFGNTIFLSLVHIGEETGSLDEMLLRAGEILEDDVKESLKRMVALIEPAIIIVLSFFIGIFVVAGLLPIVSIMDSIG